MFNLNIIYSQTYTISGKITDPELNPLIGVNVLLINESIGDASDIKGNYIIKNLTPGDYELQFSAVGYLKKRVKIKISNKSVELNVILDTEPIKTDEVIITAGKYEQKKSELTVSSEVLSGSTLKERNFRNLEDAMRFVPGVTMTEDQISIRGSSSYSRGVGARALVTIDGVPFYTGDTGEIVWEMIPTTEIQRVEIIKGAASSLYGSSAIGGVVNAITRPISKFPRTMINAFYGLYDKPAFKEWDWSNNYRPFNGITLSHSNTFEDFGFNISLTRLEDLSYRRDDFSKKYIGFLKLNYKFNSTSSLTLFANTFNKRGGTFLYWKDSRNALVNSDFVSTNRIKTNRYLLGLIYENIIDDKYLFYLKGNYYRNNFEDNGTPSNISTSHLYRLESQFTSHIHDNLILTSGVEIIPAFVNSSLFGNPKSFSAGAYSVADIKFNFPLKLSFGLRYDYGKLDTLSPSGSLNPKLGVNYKLYENLVIRSSIGTGFRNPSLAEAFTSTTASGIIVKPNPNIKAERNVTFDIGINYLFEQMFEIDFALFQNEYFKMIEASVDPRDGKIFFNNILRARIQGIELSTKFKIFSEILNAGFSYTYLNSKDVEKNIPLKYRPQNSLLCALEFTYWHLNAGIYFKFHSRVKEIDRELIDLGIVRDGDLRVPIYQTDLSFSYDLVGVRLPLVFYLNVYNLFNYNYVELIGNLRPIRSFSFGFNLIL